MQPELMLRKLRFTQYACLEIAHRGRRVLVAGSQVLGLVNRRRCPLPG
jgi:hypothetical protein